MIWELNGQNCESPFRLQNKSIGRPKYSRIIRKSLLRRELQSTWKTSQPWIKSNTKSYVISDIREPFIVVTGAAWPKTPLFSHPLKPLNAWLRCSGYVNLLRKWTLVLLKFRIPKTLKLLFSSIFSNQQRKKLEKMAVFTGDIKYFYCGEQLAEHRQSIIILSLICFVFALTLNVSFY